jgi:two-component sensor histidine kinase
MYRLLIQPLQLFANRIIGLQHALLCGVLICFGNGLHGQQKMLDANADFVVSHQLISVEQGLASRSVRDAVMDGRGFMWLATEMGLNRFDGTNFLVFTHENEGLLSNDIKRLAMHGSDRLIIEYYLLGGGSIGTSALTFQFQVFDLNAFRPLTFNEAFPDLPFPQEQVIAIEAHADNSVLFIRSAPYEVWRLTAESNWQRIGELGEWNQLSTDKIDRQIKFNGQHLIQEDELLLHPYIESGISGYRISANACIPFVNDKNGYAIRASNGVVYVYYDPSPFGSALSKNERERGFYKLTDENMFVRSTEMGELPFISNQDWRLQASNHRGEFACVNPDFGLYLFVDGQYLQVMSREQLLKYSDVGFSKVNRDQQGNYWLCTSIGLIHVSIRERLFANYFTKSELGKAEVNQVRGIYVDPGCAPGGGDQIYACVWRDVYTQPQLKLDYTAHRTLFTIVPHADELFFSSSYRLKKGTTHMNRIADDSTAVGAWACHSLNDSMMLHGTSLMCGGIYVLNTRTGSKSSSIRSNGSIPNPTVVYRFVNTQKKGIVAVAENGVFRLDSNWNIAEYWGPEGDVTHRLDISDFYDLHEDKQGVCWLATANQGLFRWDWNAAGTAEKPAVRQFGLAEGLPALRLYRIEEDDRENLWISTYNGLMRFDKKNFSAFNFYTKDGLTHNEFNRISSFKASNGKMYFGGVNGLNAFDPARVDEVYFNRSYPLQILRIQRYSDESDTLVSMLSDWRKNQSLTISHADRFLSVDFALLDYVQRIHRYAYKLEGVDKEWNQIEGGSIRISQLSHGTYTLLVKAQLENGQWNEQELRIPITVLVPFYLRWSFWLVFLAALVVVIWLYSIWRTGRLERQNRSLELAVEERTKSLSKALNDRELLLMEIHHRVKNNLQIVADLLQLQKDEMKDVSQMALISDGQSRVVSMALIHQNLYQNSDLTSIRFEVFLQSLTTQITELYGMNRRAIALELTGGDFFLDIDTAIPLGLITNELITNSYKYAFDEFNVVKIKIDLESIGKGQYKMMYKDFGSGLPEGVDGASNKTLGMHLIYGLTHQLSGEIRYSYDEGSVFEITFNDSEFRSQE